MNESALKAVVAHHILSVPNDPRSEAELEVYYRWLMEDSIFSPLISVMEATPAVMEARSYQQLFSILKRDLILVNTDPQRRCYNGCFASSELQWSAWEILETHHADRLEDRLEFWRSLADYGAGLRGNGTRSEYKAVPVNT